MLIKNQTDKLKLKEMFHFLITLVLLLTFTFGSLFFSLNKTYAQETTASDKEDSQPLKDSYKDFTKGVLDSAIVNTLRNENNILKEENAWLNKALDAMQLGEEDKELLKENREVDKRELALKKTIEELTKENSELKLDLEKARNYSSQLESKSKELYLKLQNQEEQERDRASLDIAYKYANSERIALRQQKQELLNKIDEILKQARDKEATLYAELATIYTKVKLFDLAIAAYENSLKLNVNNAEAHYNIGLLYNQVYKDRKKAIMHMKKYLSLCPQAKNKKETQYLIDMLSEDMY